MSALTIPNFLTNSKSRGLANSLQQNSGFKSIPYISLDNTRFTPVYSDGTKGKPVLEIDVVIVDANQAVSKQYYDSAYNPANEEVKGPACFSYDGIKPHKNASKPQNSSCATCPLHAWGSKINPQTGKSGRACQDTKRLAVIIPDLDVNSVFLLRVPPASLRNLSEYSMSLQENMIGDRRIEPSDVVTRISFGDFKSLGFKAVGFINESIYNAIQELDKKDTTGIIVGRIEDLSFQNEGTPHKSISYVPKESTPNYSDLYQGPKKEVETEAYKKHFVEIEQEKPIDISPVKGISGSIEDKLREAFNMQVG